MPTTALLRGERVHLRAPRPDDRDEFLVAVQWHAETLVHRPEQAALFRALVTASARRSGMAVSEDRP